MKEESSQTPTPVSNLSEVRMKNRFRFSFGMIIDENDQVFITAQDHSVKNEMMITGDSSVIEQFAKLCSTAGLGVEFSRRAQDSVQSKN